MWNNWRLCFKKCGDPYARVPEFDIIFQNFKKLPERLDESVEVGDQPYRSRIMSFCQTLQSIDSEIDCVQDFE